MSVCIYVGVHICELCRALCAHELELESDKGCCGLSTAALHILFTEVKGFSEPKAHWFS